MIPCEQGETIKSMDRRMEVMERGQIMLQEDVREAFGEIKESMKQQTEILVGLARSDEKIVTLFKQSEDNKVEIEQVKKDLREIKTKVCSPTGVKLSSDRKSDKRLDKTQLGLIIGAVSGFLTFIYTTVNKMLDYILSGGGPTP